MPRRAVRFRGERLPAGPKGASPFGIPVRGDTPLNPPDNGGF